LRILANENVAGSIIRSLRERGHDVVSVKESMRGASDREVLARAHSDRRIVLTHDKDFGELAFRSGLPAACGIILACFHAGNPSIVRQRILKILESEADWAGNFAILTETQIRVRPLPLTRGIK